tara:strand:+ start:1315 stop:1710 length:396 start_codon:yes stop_codon:yes gene_type:complete
MSAYDFTSANDIGTLTAYDDLSAKQYYFVKLQSATQVTACAAITDKPIGVLQNNPTAGQQAIVRPFGVSEMSADGTIAVGASLGTSADGQADSIAAGTDTTVYLVGTAIGAASAGETFTALINCAGAGRAA